jgi:hypothetical protein
VDGAMAGDTGGVVVVDGFAIGIMDMAVAAVVTATAITIIITTTTAVGLIEKTRPVIIIATISIAIKIHFGGDYRITGDMVTTMAAVKSVIEVEEATDTGSFINFSF